MRREMKPTSRRAWTEVRDYTQREIQSREAMVGALKEDVVREMVKLRVSKLSCMGEEADKVCRRMNK